MDYDIKNSGNNILYRLKEIGLNGNVKYGPVIKVVINNYQQLTMSPNPAHDKITVTIPENIALQNCNLLLYNSLGVLQLSSKNINRRQFPINVAALPKGVYWLKIETPEASLSKALIIE